MSYDLEILSETSYQNFLNQLDDDTSYEEIEEFFNKAVIYDTSFSYFSGADRLLDVINEAEPYSDDFTKEFNHNMYRMRKNQLIEIVHDPVNDYLREKWAFANRNMILYSFFPEFYMSKPLSQTTQKRPLKRFFFIISKYIFATDIVVGSKSILSL